MPLAVTVVVEDAEWSASSEAAFRREVKRLERALGRLKTPDGSLVATCRAVRDGSVLLRLELTQGSAPVRVHRVVPHVVPGLSVLFDTLVARLVGGSAPRHGGAEAVAAVYPAFAWFARRETALAEAEANHPAGTIDADDLTGAVVEEVLGEVTAETAPEDVLERLQRAFLGRLRAEEDDLADRVVLEEPVVPPVRIPLSIVLEQQGEAMDSDWWPEERSSDAIRLPDPSVSGAEDALADHEDRARLVRALFELAPGPRRNWAEVLLDGWAIDSAAAAQGRSEDDLRRELAESRTFLARKLGLPEDRVDAEYLALGARYRDEVPELARRAG